MFGLRMPLLQQVEGEGGAAGNIIQSATDAVAGLTSEKSGIVDSGQPSNTTDTEPTSNVEASRVRVPRKFRPSPSAEPEKKGKKGDITVQSTTDMVTTEGEDMALAYIGQREQAFTYAVGAAELQAGKASVAALQQWAELNEKQAEGREMLINEAFPRWRAANEQLSKDIDEARRMKVNPYSYMNRIGRAGRASSVLAVGLGQLAAGAGNPNSVYLRYEAAVNREIAAQKANITQAWKGIEAKRQLNQDEINLLETQFNFEDRARAVAYAGMAARVGAAKQHAKNETIYLNMQMVEERALAQSITAAAQARAKLATFMLDAKVHSVHAAMRKAEKGRLIREMRQRQVDAKGMTPDDAAAAIGTLGGPLQSLDGTLAPTEAPGAPAVTASAPGVQPAPAPTSAPAAAAVSRDRRRPQTPAEAPAAPQTTAGSAQGATAAPEAAEAAPAAPEAAEKATQPAAPAPAAQRVDYAAQYGDERVRKHGSWARAAQAAEGFTPSGPTLNEMVATIRDPNTVDYAIAENFNDAIVLAEQLPEPDQNDPVFKNSDGSMNQIAWESARRQYRQLKNHPEAFMMEMPNRDFDGKHAPGRNNVLTMPSGDVLHIKADKEHLMSDSEKRSELEAEVAKTYRSADELTTAAQTYQQMGGTSSILGMRIDSEKGFVWEPASAEHKAAVMGLRRILLGSGIQAIKQLDEAGRLSNEDVGFGKQLVATMDEGTSVTLDNMMAMYQRAFGKPGTLSDIRLAAGRVFGAAIKGYLLQLDTEISPNVVMSGEAIEMNRQRAAHVQDYIHGSEERFKNQLAEEERERKVKETTPNAPLEAITEEAATGAAVNAIPGIGPAINVLRGTANMVEGLMGDDEE